MVWKSSALTSGIHDPGRPDCWLVPPWDEAAGFHQVVRHFLVAEPPPHTSPAVLLAYFEGYAVALAAAPKDGLVHPVAWQWHDELRDAISACIAALRDNCALDGWQQQKAEAPQ